MEKGDADPGVLNAAGHDAVYEAENADKSDVVDWVLGFGEMLEGVGVVNSQANGDNGNHQDEDEGEDEDEDEEKLSKLDIGEGSSKNQELSIGNGGAKEKKDSGVTEIDGAKEEEVSEKMSKMDIQTPSTLPDISTPQADVIR